MFWLTLALKYAMSVLLYVFIGLTLYLYVQKKEWSTVKSGSLMLTAFKSDLPLIPPGTNWDLDAEKIIGRDPGCGISLPDLFVSGRHVRIFTSGGSCYVEDLGSANGTFINGKPLSTPERLLPGDRLQIGRVTLGLNTPHQGQRHYMLSLAPGMILMVGGLSLYWQQIVPFRDLCLMAVIALLLSATAIGLQPKGLGSFLFLPVATLSALSLVFLFRIDPVFGLRQFYWIILGVGVFWLIQLILKDYKRLSDYQYIFMGLAVVSLLMTVILGTTVSGSRSWLMLGNLHFEPSELVKIFIIIFLAGYLDENKEVLRLGTRRLGRFLLPDWPYLGPLLAAIGLSLLLLVFEKDLGMALLFFSIFISMVYAATNRLFHLFSGFLLFFGCAAVMYMIFPHVQERVLVFINPWQYASTGGYQIIQSLFALGGAGWLGWGLGSGWPALIPAVHTDFIFPLVGEETGLLGALGILALYLLLAWQGFRVALQVSDSFGRLLAFGFSALLAIQTLIIIGGVTDAIPLTGITLPFLSYGGSSYITNSFMIGFLVKLSEYR
ncbi:MAG: FtsW/RodA/SpoVE family cell cycle protein [Thermacetogeniaceae bacterium]